MFQQILFIAFFSATTVQLFFWLYFFARLVFYKTTNNPEVNPGLAQSRSEAGTPPVSVIICARNEAENLRNHLDRILNQTYRSFEVLIVNHKSSDKTLEVLSSLQHKFKHLRIVNFEDERTGKKFPLAKGIEQARYEILLMTDADCVPTTDYWIQGMVAGMNENTQVVLGVAPYDEAPGPLNKFIRYEACYTAMQYIAFALAGFPYMGVGRNLAYRRELFDRSGGFRRHEHLASGDDDLFINEVAHKGNVGIQLHPDTFVYSKPKANWREYYRQKTRHFTTGKHYKLKDKILLFSLTMSHLLHYVLLIALVILKISTIFALLGYAVRMGVVMAVSAVILTKLQHRSLRLWVPALDAALVIFYFVFSPSVLMNKDTQRWN
jgi:cellulose synthase/poly-beta-1,6-N-acetylglucosamine synthase-like glycosyltransferase